jgi:hypothetical protein
MSKANRIRDLAKTVSDKHEIAAIIGCDVQYVRVVLHQRSDENLVQKTAIADINYEAKFLQKFGCTRPTALRRADPATRERNRTYMRNYMRKKREAAHA